MKCCFRVVKFLITDDCGENATNPAVPSSLRSEPDLPMLLDADTELDKATNGLMFGDVKKGEPLFPIYSII